MASLLLAREDTGLQAASSQKVMFPGPEHLTSLYPGAEPVGERKTPAWAQAPPAGTSHHPLLVTQFTHLQGALRRVSRGGLDWALGSTGAVVGSGLGTQGHHQGQG